MKEFLVDKKISRRDAGNFKCFLHCLLTKYGWMDEVGGFSFHVIKQLLLDSAMEQAIVDFVLFECTAIRSMDKCQRALTFTECFWKKTTENQVKRK